MQYLWFFLLDKFIMCGIIIPGGMNMKKLCLLLCVLKGEFNIICNLHELDERGSEVYKDGSMDFKLVDTVILNIK